MTDPPTTSTIVSGVGHTRCPRRKSFRLIYPDKYKTIFPVDEFRAQDTTQIFVARSAKAYAVEKRAEEAADPRFCLNRMVGGETNPLSLMLTAAHPRGRSNAIVSVSMSLEECSQAAEDVKKTTIHARASSGSDLVSELASMDMTIYSATRQNDSQRMWSRRDAIARAIAIQS